MGRRPNSSIRRLGRKLIRLLSNNDGRWGGCQDAWGWQHLLAADAVRKKFHRHGSGGTAKVSMAMFTCPRLIRVVTQCEMALPSQDLLRPIAHGPGLEVETLTLGSHKAEN